MKVTLNSMKKDGRYKRFYSSFNVILLSIQSKIDEAEAETEAKPFKIMAEKRHGFKER